MLLWTLDGVLVNETRSPCVLRLLLRGSWKMSRDERAGKYLTFTIRRAAFRMVAVRDCHEMRSAVFSRCDLTATGL